MGRIGVFVLCLLFSLPMSAGGEEPINIPDADEAALHDALYQIRYMNASNPGITTSKCIGNPITPLCAAETAKAIGDFGGVDLSGIAHGTAPGVEELPISPDNNSNTFCYQLVGYWYFHSDDRIFDSSDRFQPGDVGLQFRSGVMVDGVCDLFFYKASPFIGMLMRKGQYGWYKANSHPHINYVQRPEWYE